MEAAELLIRLKKITDEIYKTVCYEKAPVVASVQIDGKWMMADVRYVQRQRHAEEMEMFRKQAVVEIILDNIREWPKQEPPETTRQKRWKRKE